MIIQGSPQDFGKLGSIGMLEQISWAKIPTYYYDFRRFDLPIVDDVVTQEFGRSITIFDNQGVDPDGARQTNAAIGSGVNEAFVALGAGIVAMGEGEGFAVQGALVDLPEGIADLPPISLSFINLSEHYVGAVDLSDQPDAQFATLWWGAPTWRFIEKFFQAYRLQITVNARFQIVDESLFDVGMAPVPPEFVGASSSRIPTMPFIRAVNEILEGTTSQAFLPANVACDSTGTSICTPPPLAEVTYGHPRIIGMANRIYCFNQPILFIPGMRFEVDFVNIEDISVYTALRNSITLNCTTPVDRFNPAIDGGPSGICGQVCTVPGGSVSLGVVFKGFALWPQAAVEYLANYLVPNSMHAAMYAASSDSSYLSGLLASTEYDARARSRIAGNLGMAQEINS